MSEIRKAIIPAAGFGTRMLPISKSIPKEMFPVGTKPVIQYAMEEAAASGIEEIILVTRSDKSLTQSYFSSDVGLESFLSERYMISELATVRELSRLPHLSVVRQDHQRGLGDAIMCARDRLANETFAVILPDALIISEKPVIQQLKDAYLRLPGSYVATQRVESDEFHRFGVLSLGDGEKAAAVGALQVNDVVEKPDKSYAPFAYGIFGRYLLEPDIFEFMERATEGCTSEIQLSNALASYCHRYSLYALPFLGKHYDTGCKTGYIQAVLELSLVDPEVDGALRSRLAGLTRSH